jgi:hypothetical protein
MAEEVEDIRQKAQTEVPVEEVLMTPHEGLELLAKETLVVLEVLAQAMVEAAAVRPHQDNKLMALHILEVMVALEFVH